MTGLFGNRVRLTTAPGPQRGCDNTTFPIEPDDTVIHLLSPSKPPANTTRSVYLDVDDIARLKHVFARLREDGLASVDKPRGKQIEMATEVESVAVCKTRPQTEDPECCAVCTKELSTTPTALTLRQHINKRRHGRGTIVRVAHVHLNCTEQFIRELDAVVTEHTDDLLGDAL